MANGVRVVDDIFGAGRLAQQIRLNREEAEAKKIREQQGITRGLQQQGLRLGIQEKQASLADQERQRQLQTGLQTALSQDTGESQTLKAIKFYGKIDPKRSQEITNSVFATAANISKVNPQEGINHVNKELSTNWTLEEETPETFTINQGDKISIVDKATQETLRELPITQQLTPQQKAFSLLTPEQQAATFFKSGQTIEMTKDGGFKITSGGTSLPEKKFEAKEKEAKLKADKRRNQAISKTDIVLTKVDEAIENIGLATAGFGGAALGLIPGTPARDLQGSIDTIKANLAFQALQDMREASPTGGALGAVSERELNLLESTITSLDRNQSPERLRENLQQIKDLFESTKRTLDVAESFRQQGLDPNNLTEDQIQTQIETGVKIVIPNHPVHGDVTEDDIKKTMEDTGLSESEVLNALGVK